MYSLKETAEGQYKEGQQKSQIHKKFLIIDVCGLLDKITCKNRLSCKQYKHLCLQV